MAPRLLPDVKPYRLAIAALPLAALCGLRALLAVSRAGQERRRFERMWQATQALHQVSQAIMLTTGDLSRLMETVESVAKTMRYDHGGVFLVQEDGSVDLAVSYGYLSTRQFRSRQKRALRVVQQALAQGKAQGRTLHRDMAGAKLVPAASWQALFSMDAGDKTLGALVVASDGPPTSPDEAISLGESLATLVAIGVQNVNLYRQREELAAAGERNRLARDIHDGVAQSLYMLSLHLESCAEQVEAGPASLKERLEGALSLCRSALWETRQYILDEEHLLSKDGRLKEALGNLVQESRAIGALPIQLSVSGEERDLPLGVRTALYRVVQEAIANAYKHARASQIIVRLEYHSHVVGVQVEDNGVGFLYQGEDEAGPALGRGHGLHNMRRRVEELGGTFEIVTGPGKGVRAVASVPC